VSRERARRIDRAVGESTGGGGDDSERHGGRLIAA
jgi:hypothetical protein